jgi:hypothetical protein
VVMEKDGERERLRRRREGERGQERNWQGQRVYGAGPFFVLWRMRRGTKQKVDRATTATPATLRCESAAGSENGKPSLSTVDCDFLADPNGARRAALY